MCISFRKFMRQIVRGHGFRVGLHGGHPTCLRCPAQPVLPKKPAPPGMTNAGTVVYFQRLFSLGTAPRVFLRSQIKTKSEKLGYSLGLDIGKSFKKNDLPVDKDAFIRGLLDGLSGKNPLLSNEEIRSIQQAAIMEMRIKLSGKRQIWGESNRKNGVAYCA